MHFCNRWVAGHISHRSSPNGGISISDWCERKKYLPFLLTTTVMMEAVKAGAGREDAHAAIKQHALATVRDLRSGKVSGNDLVERLAKDKR